MGFWKDVGNYNIGGPLYVAHKHNQEKADNEIKKNKEIADAENAKIKKEQDMIDSQKATEAKNIREKQIRMLRSNYRSPLLQNNPRGLSLGSSPGLSNKVGG